MAAPRNRLPIGRFAASVRLSVKALRHYDELGLLAPAFVDATTGYRYYEPVQAREALMIAMLRELDVPLATIRQALRASPAELSRMLAAEAGRVERELGRRRRALLSLQHLAQAGSLAPYAIELREAAPLRVARRTLDTTVDRMVAESGDAVYALLADLRGVGWTEEGPIFCENEDPRDDGSQQVHVCATVPPELRLASAELAVLPGGSFATLLHVGPYEALGLAYHALHAFAQERGHERRGPMREIYLNDPAGVAPAEIQTEVWLPI